jgi:hypothetical protein
MFHTFIWLPQFLDILLSIVEPGHPHFHCPILEISYSVSRVKYQVLHRSATSRNLQLETDHHQDVYLRLPEVITIGLNIGLEPRHPLEKNLDQRRLFESVSLSRPFT